jgi:glutamate--cysteine ligase
VAAFANSPFREGKPTGWRSSRQQVWTGMDPGRTRPPRVNGDGDPRPGWAGYALDARLMCVRSPGADWSAPPGLTLRDWIRRGPGSDGLRPPDADDLDYHLSTLFPPVRPRGHFEIRMIDAQRGDGWIVPLAVATALLSDEQASTEALAAVERLWSARFPAGNWPADDWPDDLGVDGPDANGSSTDGSSANGADPGGSPWLTAARCGPDDPEIALASRACFTAARAALDRMGVPAAITASVDIFIDSYVSRNRCPADDLLKEIA